MDIFGKRKNWLCNGFTLIELLVVISIIGLLSTAAIISLDMSRKKARDARRMADLKQVQKAIEMYFQENGQYPAPARGYGTYDTISGHCPNGGNFDNYIPDLVPKYLKALPLDPKFDAGGQCYYYMSNGSNYSLMAHTSMESVCGGDPSHSCNPKYIQELDRPCCAQLTIAVSSPGGRNW